MNIERPITWIQIAVSAGIFIVFILVAITAIMQKTTGPRVNAEAAKLHNLAVAMFSYSNDRNQTYPSGATSTAVFNQLYAEKYLEDPADVYLPGPGKVLYTGGQPIKLTCQNVSVSVVVQLDGKSTTGVSGDDPDLPLLISGDVGPYTFVDGLNFVSHKSSSTICICTLSQQSSFLKPGSSMTPANFKTWGNEYVIVGP